MNASLLDIIKLVADVAIVPLVGMIWSVQGRLSKIEGKFETMLQLMQKGK